VHAGAEQRGQVQEETWTNGDSDTGSVPSRRGLSAGIIAFDDKFVGREERGKKRRAGTRHIRKINTRHKETDDNNKKN
jgi:hypothetical protein